MQLPNAYTCRVFKRLFLMMLAYTVLAMYILSAVSGAQALMNATSAVETVVAEVRCSTEVLWYQCECQHRPYRQDTRRCLTANNKQLGGSQQA